MKTNLFKLFGLLLFASLVVVSCRNEKNKIEETCFDEIKNQDEFRVDCGGVCPPCEPTCDDGYLNQDEQAPPTDNFEYPAAGIDCGGENCPPCNTCSDGIQNAHWIRTNLSYEEDFSPGEIPNQEFALDSNLVVYRLIMEEGVDCGFVCGVNCTPACDDGIQNGDEEGIDCGGSCTPCPPPNCNDGVQNGTETGIDCGDLETLGLVCGDCPDPTCNDGIQNLHIELNEDVPQGYIVVTETGIDCDDNPLTDCPDCPPYTCYDGIQNGAELGVDCGGSCGIPCPDPTCGNGIMDGAEAGVDCDFDDTTPCPPCASCPDGVKNGPEYDVDCVDYPIPAYPCEQCISCHDGIKNPETYELDIDCGGVDCDACPQFVSSQGIGSGAGSAFLDQYSFNKLQAEGNNTDTLSLPNGYPGLEISSNLFAGYTKITANQGIQTQDYGIYIRTIEIYIPTGLSSLDEITFDADDVGSGTIDMGTNIQAGATSSTCPIPPLSSSDAQKIPYFTYKESFTEGGPPLKCYVYDYQNSSSTLSIQYLYGTPQASKYLIKASISGGEIKTGNDFQNGNQPYEGSFDDVTFNVQIPFF